MYPTLNLLGKTIGSYSLLSLIGLVITAIFLYLLNRNRKTLPDQLLHISLCAVAGLLIGAHLLYGITRIPAILDVIINKSDRLSTIKDYFFLLMEGFNGMVFYGGLFGGLIAGLMYCKYVKLDQKAYLNATVPGIPLFHAFGRIGCFLSGCCYGIESRFGPVYQRAIPWEANHVQRFPVQLLEATLDILLCVFLTVLLIKFGNRFSLIKIYLLCYSIIRFFDEFLRGDEIRGIWGPLSTSQWISLFIIIFLCIRYLQISKLYKSSRI